MIVLRTEKLSDDVTLILGDCREVIPTLGKVDAVVTDPPYGISAVLGMGGGSKGSGGMWKGVSIPCDEDVSARDDAITLAASPFAAFAKINTPKVPGTLATVCWDKGEHT